MTDFQNMTHADAMNALHHIARHLNMPIDPNHRMNDAATGLRRAALRIDRMHLEAANGIETPTGARWTDEDRQRNDRREAAAMRDFMRYMAEAMGSDRMARLVIENQGDCRGNPVNVHIKDGPQNVATFW